MEVVINKCFGGFGLSNKAIERYFELKGQKIWFYKQSKIGIHDYIKTTCDDSSFYVGAYSKDFGDSTTQDIEDYSLYTDIHSIKRTDPILVKVVKELGIEAGGDCASLKVVEIPDDIEWEINDYDGLETIEEVHRSWG